MKPTTVIIVLLSLIVLYLFWGIITTAATGIFYSTLSLFALIDKYHESILAILLGLVFLVALLFKLTSRRATQ